MNTITKYIEVLDKHPLCYNELMELRDKELYSIVYSDGSLNETFNLGTGYNNYVSSISIQSDGNILIAGDYTSITQFSNF